MVLSETEPEVNNECKTPAKNTFSNVDLSLDSITKSISNLTAEVIAIKNFIMDELYSLSRSTDHVRAEQIGTPDKFYAGCEKDLGRKFK